MVVYWLLLTNKLETWPAMNEWHCVLLLLQWLQDAPAYRDMQGGGAGLSAPAAQPMTPPVVGPCNWRLLDLDWARERWPSVWTV